MAGKLFHTLAALVCLAALAGFGAAPAAAQEARPLAADQALEAKVFEISHDLRCLVCQNETIAASNADLAVDLRQQVREQLVAGRTPDEIRAYMVERYGDFVLYKPPFKPLTWVLWIGPFVLLAAMTWVMSRLVRQRRAAAAAAAEPLSDAESRRARQLLSEPGADADPGACRAWGAESENRPQRADFLPDSPPHSRAMGQEDGEKAAAAADLQPETPKSDRLLDAKARTGGNEPPR